MTTCDSTPFGDGPVRHLDGLLALPRFQRDTAARRAAVAFFISWPPLVALALWEGFSSGNDLTRSLFADFLGIARYAIAVPLFVLAESIYVPQLCRIHRAFASGGFVAEPDRERFAALTSGIERLLASTWLELALVAVVFALTFGLRGDEYLSPHSSWDTPVIDGSQQKSLAGWWRILVSHPLFLVLLLRSFVRLGAWARVLWGIAHLNLRLIPAHADLAGGLRFVTTSVYAFLPLVFIFGLLMAARVVQGILLHGFPLSHFRNHIIATTIVAVVIFAGPLLFFQKKLWELKVQGLFDYGVLATRVGRRFEARWLPQGSEMTADVLAVPDFSATADLFGLTANVRASRLFLIDTAVLVPLVITVLLPFVPVLFAVVPVDDVLAAIGRAVL